MTIIVGQLNIVTWSIYLSLNTLNGLRIALVCISKSRLIYNGPLTGNISLVYRMIVNSYITEKNWFSNNEKLLYSNKYYHIIILLDPDIVIITIIDVLIYD